MIRENLELYEYEYPFYDRVNSKIQTYIESLECDSSPDHTLDQTNIKWIKNSELDIVTREINVIVNWITELVNRDCFRPKLGDGRKIRLKCSELWGIKYEKGMHLGLHSHDGYAYSFSYSVSISKRSSPIIFTTSGCKIKQKDGKLVVFDSRLKHRVPHSKVEGKCILAGNFIYDWEKINN
tara:strand:- start:37 stop:579 length:543 start_codon:yes stop_codon:yes gene_type:complete